jgi:ActR/RegA family two-component response regulator
MDTEVVRVLFVDDEPSIRITLPAILERHGFSVTIAATVAEALRQIQSQQFDVLIADLNIGEPSDGFTVVSAMRRTQSQCVNLILTGYPAFESALQAIRSHVDDYLVKPADVAKLIESIRERLSRPRTQPLLQSQPLSALLRTNLDKIIEKTLIAMKSHPRLNKVPILDRARIDHIPGAITEIIHQLESNAPDIPTDAALKAGALHGEVRREQGYTLLMLVDDTRVLDSTVCSVLQDNLLSVDLSRVIPDLNRVHDCLEAQLQEALEAFTTSETA